MATGHFSANLFFEGHSSGHTGSNHTGLQFVSCLRAEKKGGHAHKRNKDNIYIMRDTNTSNPSLTTYITQKLNAVKNLFFFL